MSPLSTIDLTMLRAAILGERSIARVRFVKSIEDRPYLQSLRATPRTIRSGVSLAAEMSAVASAGSGETRCSDMGSTASGPAKAMDDAPDCETPVLTETDWTGAVVSTTRAGVAARGSRVGSVAFLTENTV